MSTHSTINVLQADGTVKSIYCHFDGYINGGVGQTLLESYNTTKLANKVVSLGDLSTLKQSMEKPKGHSFNSPVKNYSIAYGRDRAEKDAEPKILKNIKEIEVNKTNSEQEYNYYFDGKKWNVRQEEFYSEEKMKGYEGTPITSTKENESYKFLKWIPLDVAYKIDCQCEIKYEDYIKASNQEPRVLKALYENREKNLTKAIKEYQDQQEKQSKKLVKDTQFVKSGEKDLVIVNNNFEISDSKKYAVVNLKLSFPAEFIKTSKNGHKYISVSKSKIAEFVLSNIQENKQKKTKEKQEEIAF